MRIAFFSTKAFEHPYIRAACEAEGHEPVLFEERMHLLTAPLAAGFEAVCVFVNDSIAADTMKILAEGGTRLVLCRSAGFNHIDLEAAKAHGIAVMRVPAYSPESVAEHAVGVVLSLVRNLHHQYNRVRNGNYAMDNLAGFTLSGKTAGVVGTGTIGLAVARILAGFGCKLIGTDPFPNPECKKLGMTYVERDELFAQADIVVLQAPLTPETRHMINADTLKLFRKGSVLVNTGRGALIDTKAAIEALRTLETIHYLGIDVYEDEAGLFFEDLTTEVITDPVLQFLTTMKNVLITPHSAWLTREAIEEIAGVTASNASLFKKGLEEGETVVLMPESAAA
jgi:D-lactate dehydrogenase